jgi:DNA polymerase III subunit beta
MTACTADRDALAPILGRAARQLPDKSTIQILGTVKLEAGADGLVATATDMDRQLCERVDGIARESFAFCVDAARAAAFVASLPSGPVTFAAEGTSVMVSGGRSRARLAAFPAADFPVFRDVGADAVRSEVSAAALLRALRFTLPCVADEKTRYYLCGCLLHECDGFITAAATDGHRLAVCRVAEGPPIPRVIIPTATAERLVELLRRATGSVACALGQSAIEFVVGDAALISKLVDGTFPDYPRVMAPRIAVPLVVDRADLVGSVKRIGIAFEQRGSSRGMVLRCTGKRLRVSGGTSGDQIEIVDEINLTGPKVETGLNQRYLATTLAALDDAATVELHIRDAASAVRVCADGEQNDAIVIMPVRV